MPTQSFQSLDLAELLERLADILQRLDAALERSEQGERERMNAAYQQGVADERKRRTGRDPKVSRDG
jgi:hypothetical protein